MRFILQEKDGVEGSSVNVSFDKRTEKLLCYNDSGQTILCLSRAHIASIGAHVIEIEGLKSTICKTAHIASGEKCRLVTVWLRKEGVS